MPGRMAQREVTATLDELVSRWAIASYATNLDTRRWREPIRLTIIAEDGDLIRRERLWLKVRQTLEPLAEKVVIEIEFRPPR